MSTPAGVHRARVEWIDTDAAGIHHNTTIVRYAESAEAQLVRDLGLDDYFVSAPRVRYEVDFLSPLRFGDHVIATTRVAAVGRSSLTLEFEVVGGPEGEERPVARGRYVTVHLGADGVAPWPDEWRAALSVEP